MGLTICYTPTKVVFGKGAEAEVGRELRNHGAHHVLIHYGSERIRKTGLLEKTEKLLDAEGITYTELGGVQPNPRVSLVRKGVEICKKENVDFILAIGGGSVIDSCKAIAYGTPYSGDVWDFYSRKAVPAASTPVGCILTMAAAGSEMSDSSVITNEDGGLKRGCNSDLCRLKFALENPEFTTTLPAYQTACAIVDIQMHTMERYFTGGDTLELTDSFALSLIRTVRNEGLKALKEPDSYDARANLMWASSVSHNGLLAMGNNTKGDWATHQIEHELSGMFDVAHGAGLACIWPAWAKYVNKVAPERFIRLGKEVFDGKISTPEETIAAFEAFYKELGMPVRVSEMGITLTEEQIDELAEKASFFGERTLGTLKVLKKEDMKEIYRLAK